MSASILPDQHPDEMSAAVDVHPSASLPDPPTSIIGRDQETADVVALLKRPDVRLVTLTGPGGVGKTRLAINAAKSRWPGDNPPVAFVPLAPVRDATLVVPSIGAAFGLSDSGAQSLVDRLTTILGTAPFLLILDNFEHVVDAAVITRQLLDSCPALSILVTSRRPLRVSGEVEYRVPPFDTPGPDSSRDIVERSTSWRLFVERSQTVHIDGPTSVNPAESVAIGEICRRLDGLPLAIELAAARTRVLPPSELLARLDRQLPLLTDGPIDSPDRLRSMRDAIAWSYELLTEDEQQLLRSLAVFSGGFTLGAVEAVAPDDLESSTLDLLTQLIDHNLVRLMETETVPARFTMLETIREFALEALQAAGEEISARERHLTWMVEFVGSPAPEQFNELRGPADAPLYAELNNLRAALSWALDRNESFPAAQIAWAMLRIWFHYGLTLEGLESVKRLADQAAGLEPFVRGTVIGWIASLAHEQGDDELGRSASATWGEVCKELGYTKGINDGLWGRAQSTMWFDPAAALDLFNQAVESGRTIEDKRVLACDLNGRSWAYICLGDAQNALADLAEARPLYELFEGHDEVRYEYSLALSFTAWALGMSGRIDDAARFVEKGRAFSEEFNIGIGLFTTNRVRCELSRTRGDLKQSYVYLRECLQTAHREAQQTMLTYSIVQAAMIAQDGGDFIHAARLIGYADAYWSKFQFAESTRSMATWSYTTEPTQSALGPLSFVTEFDTGRRFTSFDAFTEAMSVNIPDRSGEARATGLTRRESEVLVHLATGKTNQEIADELFLGKSTVDTHVAHILAKLGVDSRRAAVVEARGRGLIPK